MIAANTEGQQSLTHLLKGVFAYAYSGYHAELPSVALLRNAPRIGSYLERTRPATSAAPQRGWEFYDEIDGYVLVDYVGWIDFHGDGRLSGGGTTQRAGSRAVPFTHAGTYTVESAQPLLLSGELARSPSVILTHAVASTDSTRKLKFTVLDSEKGRLVAAGTMVQR
ncbi:MAG TPA: hypothetical protein VIM15_13260 [Gemmatimonadaceae bacterium]